MGLIIQWHNYKQAYYLDSIEKNIIMTNCLYKYQLGCTRMSDDEVI